MEFEIDVSGEDLLSKNYTICLADRDSIIKGFKFNEEIVSILCSRYGQGNYKYSKSKRGKSLLRVRLYCIIIYHLFKSIKDIQEVSLNLCRDFDGRESEIKDNLRFFFSLLNISLSDRIYFSKLSPDSNAHKYAYLMAHDTKNKMNTYIKISIDDMEKWLNK